MGGGESLNWGTGSEADSQQNSVQLSIGSVLRVCEKELVWLWVAEERSHSTPHCCCCCSSWVCRIEVYLMWGGAENIIVGEEREKESWLVCSGNTDLTVCSPSRILHNDQHSQCEWVSECRYVPWPAVYSLAGLWSAVYSLAEDCVALKCQTSYMVNVLL